MTEYTVSIIVLSFFNSAVLSSLIYLFFNSLLFRRAKTSIIITLFLPITILLCICISANAITQVLVFPNYLIVFYAALAASLVFKTKWYNYFVLAFVFAAIYAVGLTIGSSIFSIINAYAGDDSSEFAAAKNYFFINGSVNMIVFIVIMIIRLSKHKFFQHAPPKQALFMVFTPISTLGILITLQSIVEISSNQSYSTLIYIAICCFLMMTSNIAVFYYVDSLRENSDNSHAIHAANQLIKAQTYKYNEMMKSRELILKLQHDYKNLFLGLISTIDNDNIETVRENLKLQYRELTEQTPIISDGNILQTLIDMKQEVLKQNNIRVTLECKNFDRSKISNIDLAIIFGNAFENAIEACMKLPVEPEKVIYIHLQVKYNTLVLIIKNPVKRQVKVEYLKTTKDVFGHGYGILSMKNIAEKYNGTVDFECDENEFTAYITLRNIPNEDSEQ